MPAFFAARSAIVCQTVTDISESRRLRRITPAAAIALVLRHLLRAQDQVDGAPALFADQLVLRAIRAHAEHLREHQRGDAVAVHARAVVLPEITVLLLRLGPQHKAERLFHRLSLRRRIGGLMTARSQREDAERSHRGLVPHLVVDAAARRILRREQILRRPRQRVVHFVLRRATGMPAAARAFHKSESEDRRSKISSRLFRFLRDRRGSTSRPGCDIRPRCPRAGPASIAPPFASGSLPQSPALFFASASAPRGPSACLRLRAAFRHRLQTAGLRLAWLAGLPASERACAGRGRRGLCAAAVRRLRLRHRVRSAGRACRRSIAPPTFVPTVKFCPTIAAVLLLAGSAGPGPARLGVLILRRRRGIERGIERIERARHPHLLLRRCGRTHLREFAERRRKLAGHTGNRLAALDCRAADWRAGSPGLVPVDSAAVRRWEKAGRRGSARLSGRRFARLIRLSRRLPILRRLRRRAWFRLGGISRLGVGGRRRMGSGGLLRRGLRIAGIRRSRELPKCFLQVGVGGVHRGLRLRGLLRLLERLLRVWHLLLRGLLQGLAELLQLFAGDLVFHPLLVPARARDIARCLSRRLTRSVSAAALLGPASDSPMVVAGCALRCRRSGGRSKAGVVADLAARPLAVGRHRRIRWSGGAGSPEAIAAAPARPPPSSAHSARRHFPARWPA